MKYLLIPLIISYTSIHPNTSLRHNITVDSISYIKKAVDFIRAVNPNIFLNERQILSDKIVQPAYASCLQAALNDSVLLSKADRLLLQRNRLLRIARWQPSMLPGIHLISQETIDSIFRSSHSWPLSKTRGLAHISFSMPAFLDNGAYCVFYQEYISGTVHASYGHLSLYKQTGDKWEIVKTYCDWIT